LLIGWVLLVICYWLLVITHILHHSQEQARCLFHKEWVFDRGAGCELSPITNNQQITTNK